MNYCRTVLRSLQVAARFRFKHTLPELPYSYGALAPVISQDILEVHHGKHHATYVNNLNAAEEALTNLWCPGAGPEERNLADVVKLQQVIDFNAGGHLNHAMYWENLSPDGGGKPGGDLLTQINQDFKSFDQFRKTLSNLSVGVKGSGWGWLIWDPQIRRLRVTTTSNQDMVTTTGAGIPLLTIDVWEHAYYLQYKNVRPEYVKAIWDIINWPDVERRFENVMAQQK